MDTMESLNSKEIAVFGGGCFWCTEAIFKKLRGVHSVLPGYSGGTTENPTYEEVSGGRTRHAEVIRIEFNPAEISFETLLTVFFATHDSTTMNRQGNDVGTQYRSAIFYTDEEQKTAAEKFIQNLNDSDSNSPPAQAGKPIVTEVTPFDAFYEAEDYHKNYFAAHSDAPYCQLVINPKLEKVQMEFAELLKVGEERKS
jgi:peptide-methionine (S)-S-oxide reductase